MAMKRKYTQIEIALMIDLESPYPYDYYDEYYEYFKKGMICSEVWNYFCKSCLDDLLNRYNRK